MKTLLTSLSILTIFAFNGTSQVNPHAIGIRGGGGNYGRGGEISYQHGMGDANRLELDLGWRGRNNYNWNNGNGSHYSHMYIAGIYHWNWNIVDGFNWFVGPGAQVGFYNDKWDDNNDGISLAIGGQIGIEYDFNSLGAPLLLGFDTRPMWGFFYGPGYGAAFSLRYTF